MAALLGVSLAACGSGRSAYPALRDIPPPPRELTPEALRESLKSDLARERTGEVGQTAGQKARREPAVPPRKPRPPELPGGDGAGAECASPAKPARLAQAIPALRGTLRGPALRPEGLTGATIAPEAVRLELRFEPGTADLSARLLEDLRLRAAAFLAEGGGGSVLIDVRGPAPAAPSAVRALDRFQLGLRRASVVADYLIAQGIASERIKLLVAQADGGVPAGGVDRALVTFRGQ